MSEEVWDEIGGIRRAIRELRDVVLDLSERVDRLAGRIEALEGEDKAEAAVATTQWEQNVEAMATKARFLGSGR